MKHLYKLFIFVFFAATFAACEKDLPVYNSTQNRLNFGLSSEADTVQTYSFVYTGGVATDTVWYTVRTMGFLSDAARTFELQQVMTGVNDAQVGTHYVSFDDETLKKRYVIPAGAVRARIPIVVKRDTTLKKQDYNLVFTFKPNNNFDLGYEAYSKVKLIISDKLSKPTAWRYYACTYFFGTYGPVKHQFMIDVTGLKWDNDFLLNTLYISNFARMDQAYVTYLVSILQKKLKELNATRAAQGLGKLSEADGSIVSFD